MDKRIRRLYAELIKEMEEDEVSKILKREVLEILERSKKDMENCDKCRDMAFRIAGVGEEAGFVRGFRYAVQLMKECE